VLEQAESLRTGGTSLTLFKNGWRVLDAIGVGNDLRRQFLEIQGYVCVHLPVQCHSSMTKIGIKFYIFQVVTKLSLFSCIITKVSSLYPQLAVDIIT
jgi:hypothetical protein